MRFNGNGHTPAAFFEFISLYQHRKNPRITIQTYLKLLLLVSFLKIGLE